MPSLFRLTLLSTTKRRKPTCSGILAQRHGRRYLDQRKVELYTDRHSAPLHDRGVTLGIRHSSQLRNGSSVDLLTLMCQASGRTNSALAGDRTWVRTLGGQVPALRFRSYTEDNRAAAKCSNCTTRHRPYVTTKVFWPASMTSIDRFAPRW
jgi:hypothetical protein